MLKSADLHETILTPVICHKHIRCHDGVTLYFSMKFPLVVPKKARNGHFSIYVSTFPLSEVKTKKKRKLWLNACKHWEPESRNRNLSAAVLHVKPSRHNSNLYNLRENHHKVEIFNYSVSLQYSKRNRDFIKIKFQTFTFLGSLSRARTLYWLWALRFISIDDKMLGKVLAKLQRNYFWCRLDREIQIWNN